MNLQTIKTLAAETRQRLAGLTSGDLDERARVRAIEKEKLAILAEEEEAELKRLEEKRIADRNMARTVLAKKFRRNAERDLAEDNRLKSGALAAFQAGIEALAARHKLWEPAAIGLLSEDAQAAFTQEEHQQLANALSKSFRPIRTAEFIAFVNEALASVSPDAREAVSRLFATPQHVPGVPAAKPPKASESVPLIEVTQALQGTPYPAPVEADAVEQPVEEAPRYEVDLRPPIKTDNSKSTSSESEFVGGAYG